MHVWSWSLSLFGRLFGKNLQNKSESITANAEMAEVERRLNDVYNRNSSYFYKEVEGAVALTIGLAVTSKSLDVSGLFALGIVMEIIEQMPPLPTPPYDRAFIHLMRFYTTEENPFSEAQERVVAVKEQLESLDKLAAYIVSQGREAANDEGDQSYLAACYAAAERRSL